MATTTPLKFPPSVTASTWATVFEHVWNIALKRGRHMVPYRTGGKLVDTLAPRLTCGEVVTLTMGWYAAAGRRWPLWYQFAAAAYGWDPSADTFATTTKQREAWYPDELLVEFWMSLMELTRELDFAGVANPRLDLDGRFGDVVFQGEVKSALSDDGADIAFKIPIPACKDPKTGKPGWPKRDPKTGKWTCDVVTIDDPVTVVKSDIGRTLLIVAALWLLFGGKPARR